MGGVRAGTPHRVLALAAVLFTAAGCTSGAKGSSSGSPPSPSQGVPTTSASLPHSALAAELARAASVGGHLWAADGHQVLEVSNDSGAVVARIPLRKETVGSVFAATGLVCASETHATDCFDAKTRRLAHHYSRPLDTAGAAAYWALDDNGTTLVRVDPTTGKTTGRLHFTGSASWYPGLAVCGSGVWITTGDDHTLRKIDPKSMRITITNRAFPAVDSLLVVACSANKVWVQQNANRSGVLFTVRPSSAQIIAKTLLGDPAHASGYGGAGIAIANGSLWTADSSPTVTRIESSTGHVLRVYQVGINSPNWVMAGAKYIWVVGNTGDGERIPI